MLFDVVGSKSAKETPDIPIVVASEAVTAIRYQVLTDEGIQYLILPLHPRDTAGWHIMRRAVHTHCADRIRAEWTRLCSTLLRRIFRDRQGRVQKQTLANLLALPDVAIEVLRAWLAGGCAPPVTGGAIEIPPSRHHGAVAAVQTAFEQLGFVQMVSSTRLRQRDLVCAMVATRILRPHSKLATTR